MGPFIRGSTRIVALLGYPVAHSCSPQIHNHAFAELKLPYAYIPLAVQPKDLHLAVYTLRACGALGANVTLPHKQRAASLCDVLSPLSQRLGTVNTLVFKDNLLHGTTTDPVGFLRALARMGYDAHGGSIVMLGNGGTARTLAAALAFERIPAALTLAGRNKERAVALAASISAAADFKIDAVEIGDEDFAGHMKRCTLLVNCTSVGMHPNVNDTPVDKKFLHTGITVFDTVYNPAKTRLAMEAESIGCPAQNGLRMLLYQGLASFALWTGVDVREEIFDLAALQRSITS